MNYQAMSAAEFTERHLVTLEQFYLWDKAGRPVLFNLPVICETLEDYASLLNPENYE